MPRGMRAVAPTVGTPRFSFVKGGEGLEEDKLGSELEDFLHGHGIEHFTLIGIRGELKPGFADTRYFNQGHKGAIKAALVGVLSQDPEMLEFYESAVEKAKELSHET